VIETDIKIMKAFLNPASILLLLLMLGCGQVNKEKYITGVDPGEVNRANPLHEKGDETGNGFVYYEKYHDPGPAPFLPGRAVPKRK
jgi:hypothetical protein